MKELDMIRGKPLSRRTPMKRTPMKRKPARRGAMDPEFRDAVLRRDRWTCQAPLVEYHPEVRCSRFLHAHHRELGTKRDVMGNVVTLCDTHHHWVHNVDRAGAELAGLITRRPAVSPAPG